MSDQITVDDLQKAARNLQRLSEFLGERRGWILASDAEAAAMSVDEAAQSLARVMSKMTGDDSSSEAPFRHPKVLEPAAKVSSVRLTKFAEFMDQLRQWFALHTDSEIPAEAKEHFESIRASIAATQDAIVQLRGPSAVTDELEEQIVSSDLGPVANVDMKANLVFDASSTFDLIQIFKGVSELTNETKAALGDFLAQQHIKFTEQEIRKLHEKVLRWIRSTPDGQSLVVKISGLTGKAEVYFSYRQKK